MKRLVIWLLPLCVLSGSAYSQGRRAVAPAPGLACMSLNVTDRQAMDPSFVVPIRVEPRGGSPVVGRAASIVLVRAPTIERNGYLSVVLFNGHEGWIASTSVQPWHNPGPSGRRCVPSSMSDGSLGFSFQ